MRESSGAGLHRPHPAATHATRNTADIRAKKNRKFFIIIYLNAIIASFQAFCLWCVKYSPSSFAGMARQHRKKRKKWSIFWRDWAPHTAITAELSQYNSEGLAEELPPFGISHYARRQHYAGRRRRQSPKSQRFYYDLRACR